MHTRCTPGRPECTPGAHRAGRWMHTRCTPGRNGWRSPARRVARVDSDAHQVHTGPECTPGSHTGLAVGRRLAAGGWVGWSVGLGMDQLAELPDPGLAGMHTRCTELPDTGLVGGHQLAELPVECTPGAHGAGRWMHTSCTPGRNAHQVHTGWTQMHTGPECTPGAHTSVGRLVVGRRLGWLAVTSSPSCPSPGPVGGPECWPSCPSPGPVGGKPGMHTRCTPGRPECTPGARPGLRCTPGAHPGMHTRCTPGRNAHPGRSVRHRAVPWLVVGLAVTSSPSCRVPVRSAVRSAANPECTPGAHRGPMLGWRSPARRVAESRSGPPSGRRQTRNAHQVHTGPAGMHTRCTPGRPVDAHQLHTGPECTPGAHRLASHQLAELPEWTQMHTRCTPGRNAHQVHTPASSPSCPTPGLAGMHTRPAGGCTPAAHRAGMHTRCTLSCRWNAHQVHTGPAGGCTPAAHWAGMHTRCTPGGLRCTPGAHRAGMHTRADRSGAGMHTRCTPGCSAHRPVAELPELTERCSASSMDGCWVVQWMVA